MPTREELHTLVDSLPDYALAMAHQMLAKLNEPRQRLPGDIRERIAQVKTRLYNNRLESQRKRGGPVGERRVLTVGRATHS